MLIDIKSINIQDRIRKDFGNIQELADDIKQNGLINPPVVTPLQDGKCDLLAGERRVRAMKLLGYQQIEVRPMVVRDAEHQLDIEISENAIRKGWTMTEMLEIARRKERISAIKGKENQANKSVSENSQKVDSSKEAAQIIGVSDNTYRRMKTIENNKNLLDPKDFAEWDEHRLSTNKAYQKVKAELEKLKSENKKLVKESENAIHISDNVTSLLSMYPDLEEFIDSGIANVELLDSLLGGLSDEDKESFISKYGKEVIVDNTDYDLNQKYHDALKKIASADKTHENDQRLLVNERKKNQQLNKELDEYKNTSPDKQKAIILKDNAVKFCFKVNSFIQDVGGYVWITEHINELDEFDRISFIKAINAIGQWADTMEYNINNKEMEIK